MKKLLASALFAALILTSPLIGQSDRTDPLENKPELSEPIPRKKMVENLPELNLGNIKAIRKGNFVQIPLPLKKSQLDRFQVSSGRSKKLSEQLQPLGKRMTDNHLNLKDGETAVLRSVDVQKTQLSTEKTYMPGRIIQVKKQGNNQKQPVVNSWKLFLKARRKPLTWQAEKNAYASDISIGLDPTGNGSSSFDGEVTVEFFTDGAGVRVQPERVTLPLKNKRNFKDVELLCTHPSVIPEIEVVSDLSTTVAQFEIQPVELELAVDDTNILGFGLETTGVHITCKAGDGTLMKQGSFPIRIEKENGKGKVPASLTKEEGSSMVHTELRSSGTGTLTLTAHGAAVKSNKKTITFVWPIILVLLTLTGGVVGSGVRLFQKNEDTGAATITGTLFVGAVSALLLVLFVATIGLGQLQLSTTIATTRAGAVVLSLLGGFAGPRVFEILAEKIGLREEPDSSSDEDQ